MISKIVNTIIISIAAFPGGGDILQYIWSAAAFDNRMGDSGNRSFWQPVPFMRQVEQMNF
jgi:hypothetical protein